MTDKELRKMRTAAIFGMPHEEVGRVIDAFLALRAAVRRERKAFAEFESYHNVEPDGADPNGSAKWRTEFTRLGAEVTATSEFVDRLVAGEES